MQGKEIEPHDGEPRACPVLPADPPPEEYGAERVIYAHLHGQSKFRLSVLGEMNGVGYSLAAGDYLRWKPLKIMD